MACDSLASIARDWCASLLGGRRHTITDKEENNIEEVKERLLGLLFGLLIIVPVLVGLYFLLRNPHRENELSEDEAAKYLARRKGYNIMSEADSKKFFEKWVTGEKKNDEDD